MKSLGNTVSAFPRTPSISHPGYRETLMKTFCDDPMMTKPKGFSLDKIPPGVILYNGKTTV
jgi:hypothetical protein